MDIKACSVCGRTIRNTLKGENHNLWQVDISLLLPPYYSEGHYMPQGRFDSEEVDLEGRYELCDHCKGLLDYVFFADYNERVKMEKLFEAFKKTVEGE